MHVVFVCPGMPFRGDFIEQGRSLGGSESACYYVAKEVAAKGHKVLVFTTDPEADGQWDGVHYASCGRPGPHAPLGEYAHAFMESTYSDALIVQRAPGVHRQPHAAKTAFWWLHDLALMRALPAVRQDNFYYDGMFAVSEWHRQQICDTWQFNPDTTHVLPNSVDASLYECEPKLVRGEGAGLNMLYQSRPERGIDYLVKPNGIMDQLLKKRPTAHLFVCGYDNTTEQMRPYYDMVYRRIEELPNCTRLPYMGKSDLAQVQRGMDLLVYPGEFEETSCITAMECQAAGLPMVASQCGALSETCDPKGARLLPLNGDGRCDEDAFVNFAAGVEPKQLNRMRKAQLESARSLSWERSGQILLDTVEERLREKRKNNFSMVRTMLDRSDVRMLELSLPWMDPEGVMPETVEWSEQYGFQDDLAAHYDSDDAVSELEKDDNLDMSQNMRFREAMNHLLPAKPSHVLDYGCQKGHYIYTAAHAHKAASYVGVEISPRIVEWARKRCRVDDVDIKFEVGDVLSENFDYARLGKFDGLILGEVLEHVPDPVRLMERLAPMLTSGCKVVITTPFGDWEGKDYNKFPDRPRYHLHHFERADLDDMFSHQTNYVTACVPAGRTAHEPIGSWVTSFDYDPDKPIANPIDYDRKMSTYAARETVSYCALLKDAESTILRSLLTVKDVADEFVIALDEGTTDNTRLVLESFAEQHCRYKRFDIVDAPSPLEIGFDEARNRTVARARGDWILWMDADEDLIYPERLHKYIRSNQYDGYGIAQNHMSADPVGLLTQDWPVRIFRRVPYLKFNGVVHEHPDDTENPNSGPRFPAQIMDSHLYHHGYTTEQVRRERFKRNLPLIKRDRKQNPDRLLGKMLYMRDLSHMCMFEAEQNGGRVTPAMRKNAEEGIKLFEDLVETAADKPIAGRMVRDGLEFYSNLVSVLNEGFEAEIGFHASKEPNDASVDKAPRRRGRFRTREHLEAYTRLIHEEQLHPFETRYW